MEEVSGSVRISRSLWDDTAFKDEPFTEREAFVWMVMEASFKAREKRLGSVVVKLQRGQLAASSRFLAKAWQWTEPRVRRYFDRLENRRMIVRVADAGVSVITLCNYEKYQSAERVGDAPTGDFPTRERRTTDANENKDEIKDIGGGGGAQVREASTEDDHDRILAAAGVDVSKDISGKWYNSEQRMWVAKWRSDCRLSTQEILTVVAESRPSHGPPGTLKYFNGAMERFSGLRDTAPLTPVAPNETGPSDARRPARPAGPSRTERVITGAVARAAERKRQAALDRGEGENPSVQLLRSPRG